MKILVDLNETESKALIVKAEESSCSKVAVMRAALAAHCSIEYQHRARGRPVKLRSVPAALDLAAREQILLRYSTTLQNFRGRRWAFERAAMRRELNAQLRELIGRSAHRQSNLIYKRF